MFTLSKNDTSENSNNMFKYFQAIVLLAFVLALAHHECVSFKEDDSSVIAECLHPMSYTCWMCFYGIFLTVVIWWEVYYPIGASLVAQKVKNLPAMQENWVRSLGNEDPLEKGMATHSSVLVWRILWTEEPGGLQSTGSQELDTTNRLTFSFHFLTIPLTTVSW